MNIKPTLALALALAFAGTARADYALAYHGKLVRADNRPISAKVPMSMEFRICGSETPDGSAPLWGRRVVVRFDTGGLFYTELRDSSGAAIEGAVHASLADAIAAANGTNAWISVTPVGYGELLPRKKLGGVHRAERAAAAAKAAKVAAPAVESRGEISVGEFVVRGDFTAERIVPDSGFTVSNTVTAGSGVSLGSPDGTVLFSPSFNWWATESWPIPWGAYNGAAAADMLGTFTTEDLGIYTIPIRQGTVGWPAGYFRISGFIAGE